MLTISRSWLEPRILGVVAAAAFVIWLFIRLADEVIEGGTQKIDEAILMAFRSHDDPTQTLGPPWLDEIIRDISGLGSPGVLCLLVAATVGLLLLTGKHRTALFVCAATLGGALVSSILKSIFERPRPETALHGTLVYDSSFPSGHAMMSAVVYLTVGALITPLVQGRWLKLYVMAMAATFSGLIGLSRIYLGVHWPSDVLAGWAAGAAWALGCWVCAEVINHKDGANR